MFFVPICFHGYLNFFIYLQLKMYKFKQLFLTKIYVVMKNYQTFHVQENNNYYLLINICLYFSPT